MSQSHDAVFSFFDAYTSDSTKNHIESHFSHSTFKPQLLNYRDWTYCPHLYALCFIYTWLTVWRSPELPRVMHMLGGLASDPKQRQGFLGMGDKPSAPLAELSTYARAHIHHWGCANAQSVPQELLSTGCCVLRGRHCHCLITSYHSPFTSQLIQSSKLLSVFPFSAWENRCIG